MNCSESPIEHGCSLCSASYSDAAQARCVTCEAKGELVADVVWSIVTRAVQDASERVTFMLAGLPAVFLEGIARRAPNGGTAIEGQSLLLAMNSDAAPGLIVHPPAISSQESPVHWRHSTAADVIVFAPSDAEREGIGAGLGPLTRIDGQRIVDEIDSWLKILNETGSAKNYLSEMLQGLRASQIFVDLEMWVDFILALKRQGFENKVDIRVQRAAPALHIPMEGIVQLPAYKEAGNPKAKAAEFRKSFLSARAEISCFASLLTPAQEPVDISAIRKTLEQFDDHNEPQVSEALAAISALLDDEPSIRPGEWRISQAQFCERVSWSRVGSYIFSGARKTKRQTLGEETLSFIEGNYEYDLTAEDREFLKSLRATAPKDVSEDEQEFFERWQERLNQPDPKAMKIYKEWRKRLFSKTVGGQDLVSTFSEGFEALVIAAGDALSEMIEPRVLVRATHHRKKMFWEKLDVAVAKLFRLELAAAKGIFGGRVYWDLEHCFKYKATDPATSQDARRIELELYLIDANTYPNFAELRTPPAAAPRVRATWQPGDKAKAEPISLALPDDIADLALTAKNGVGLFREQTFAPRGGTDEAYLSSTTLRDVNSFSDVAQAQNGRTFVSTVLPKQDVLSEIRARISELRANFSLTPDAANALEAAVSTFETAYHEAIIGISEAPTDTFRNNLLDRQAQAFGALCETCRRYAGSDLARRTIRPLIIGLGVVPGNARSQLAILTAWHPLRLAEWRARLVHLANFVEAVLGSSKAKDDDLTIAFEERRALSSQWAFPETVIVGGETLVAVEDVGGYSLLVPATSIAQSQEALESSAPAAAEKFIEGVEHYLEIHPHEATNLSAAIYDSESQSLPKELAKGLARRLDKDPLLRCDLVITHSDQDRMRAIFRNQNMRLGAENISDGAKGFLSRLRVDVRPNRSARRDSDGIPDMDLVFLHDAITGHARPEWDHERGRAEDLPEAFDVATLRTPRKRLNEVNAPGVGVYLTLPRPPRAVAQYLDLLYEIGKGAVLPDGYHGVLIRQVQLDDPSVKELVTRAHDLAEWVVSYDKISSRSLLWSAGVQIIRDISLPGADGRVIISAGSIQRRLKENVCSDLVKCCGVSLEIGARLADLVLDHVLQISGQKVLAAARYATASQEMIGLALMRAVQEASLPNDASLAAPIWFSLDDYRGWFSSGKGKIADAVAMTISDSGTSFSILIQVGEAKFVSQTSETAETREAATQVRDTVERLNRIFVTNEDPISRSAWCARLAELLVNRDGLAERLPDPLRRAAFLEALSVGQVPFRIAGDAVICLHDDNAQQIRIEPDLDSPHLRTIKLTTPFIRKVLSAIEAKEMPAIGDLDAVTWYPQTEPAVVTATEDVRPMAPAEFDEALEVSETREVDPSLKAPTHTDGEASCDGNIVVDPTSAEQAPSFSQFIPAPVARSLRAMAERETSAIDDQASVCWAETVCRETQRALSQFEMQAQFADPPFRLTPNGALVTFRGHPTLTTDKIARRKNELLTTHGIEVTDIRPGRGTISLFIKREKRAKVPLASTWLGAEWPDRAPGELTHFILGAREDADRLLYLNTAGEFADYEEHAPHCLIAGETKSGKGVLTQSLLLQLITFNAPQAVNLILIDPKQGVDFGWINSAPHLRQEIITEVGGAQAAIEALVKEMDERYAKLAKINAPNIDYYNREVYPEERLSRIYLVHDEMGAWMADEKEYRDVVLSSVANLGMKARAAGIHIILITQRADADAIPTKLRDNMGNRLCLQVKTSTGSRMALGVTGAEKLLGRGHMACDLSNENPPPGQDFFVVQVPFAEPKDLEELARQAISYWQSG